MGRRPDGWPAPCAARATRIRDGALLLSLAAALVSVATSPLAAQRIVGRVLDEARGEPVPQASVSVMDAEGEELARAITDSTGAYALEPPVGRDFHLAAGAFGYVPATSVLFSVDAEEARTFAIDLLLAPEPVGLEGFEVTAEMGAPADSVTEERIERWFRLEYGVHPASIGGKILAGTELRRLALPGRDLVDVLRWANLPGAVVTRGARGLCLMARGVGCAGIRLNGMSIPGDLAEAIPLEAVTAVVYLRSTDARALFPGRGRRSSSGRLEIFTGTVGPWMFGGR